LSFFITLKNSCKFKIIVDVSIAHEKCYRLISLTFISQKAGSHTPFNSKLKAGIQRNKSAIKPLKNRNKRTVLAGIVLVLYNHLQLPTFK
jgi:hypothetical protein